MGVAVFAIWIAPDRLFPGYRHFWLFENPLMGKLQTSLSPDGRSQTAVLWLRGFRAVAIVPIVEELFWRGWLMRWLISADFESVPLGTWSAQAFWIVALLFASEHGPYWDVGLAAGAIYNWWMLRTRSLGDLILAHAVTNACLSAYVVWQRPLGILALNGSGFEMRMPQAAIEQVRSGASAAGARVALFDFDGTLSLVRSGWVDVMVPMMVEILLDLHTGESEQESDLRWCRISSGA